MNHMKWLQAVADQDIQELRRKEGTYKGSWKKRGGIGAFMMMARKWDRLEGMLESDYDIFLCIGNDTTGEDGTALAEVRDLRRYLLLVEAEMVAQGAITVPPAPQITTAAVASSDKTNGPDSPWIYYHAELPHLPTEAASTLYAGRTRTWSHLEPAITRDQKFDVSRMADNMPPGAGRTHLRSAVTCYTREGEWYVLRAADMPAECRYCWPTLQREANDLEHSEMLPWQRALYERDDDADKWVIAEMHEAWCQA